MEFLKKPALALLLFCLTAPPAFAGAEEFRLFSALERTFEYLKVAPAFSATRKQLRLRNLVCTKDGPVHECEFQAGGPRGDLRHRLVGSFARELYETLAENRAGTGTIRLESLYCSQLLDLRPRELQLRGPRTNFDLEDDSACEMKPVQTKAGYRTPEENSPISGVRGV